MADNGSKTIGRSGNPALKEGIFSRLERREGDGVMTLAGAVNRSAVLLVLLACGFALTFGPTLNGRGGPSLGLLLPALIGGFALSMVIIFKPRTAPYLSPVYAFAEGLVLGWISAVYEGQFQGIAFQAAGLTFSILAMLLLVYSSGLIRVTDNFRLGVVAATGGIAILYLIDIVLMLFGHPVPMIHQAGPWGIAFSAVVVVIAAMNLVLDFDFIEQGTRQEAPAYMEWYAAFSLMVTLVWLYLEILRLISKMRKK